MTRQEAVKELEKISWSDRGMEAIYMAIDVLEQEQSEIIRCKNCRHDNNCEIQYSAQAGSEFFCGSAERRAEQ